MEIVARKDVLLKATVSTCLLCYGAFHMETTIFFTHSLFQSLRLIMREQDVDVHLTDLEVTLEMLIASQGFVGTCV